MGDHENLFGRQDMDPSVGQPPVLTAEIIFTGEEDDRLRYVAQLLGTIGTQITVTNGEQMYPFGIAESSQDAATGRITTEVVPENPLISADTLLKKLFGLTGIADSYRPDMFKTLSGREHDTLRQLIQGKDNASISESLGIAMNTTKSHLSKISRKTGVGDRDKLIVLYLYDRLRNTLEDSDEMQADFEIPGEI